ncbi:hypothetical protein BDF19DRAFT_434356 [Syncephalis fuscata]|nr:hypothetical protein BDF19DRAFT_434356 [Syncephalis fuscata]
MRLLQSSTIWNTCNLLRGEAFMTRQLKIKKTGRITISSTCFLPSSARFLHQMVQGRALLWRNNSKCGLSKPLAFSSHRLLIGQLEVRSLTSRQPVQKTPSSLFKAKRYSTASSNSGNNKMPNKPKPGSIRYLLKKYGRTGIIVYAAVSTAGYILCVLGVYLAGADHVLRLEYWVHSTMAKYFPNYFKHDESTADDLSKDSTTPNAELIEEELEEKARRDPTWTSLLLIAYGLHEILTPVRVAAAVALTPPIARRYRHIRWLVGAPK